MYRKKIQDDTNKEKYAHGAIFRIKLENFITYDSLEFQPGPNLNVIIGPNGTGKSTIVCAICLGMTGKSSVLGRQSNIADFIKYGKQSGSIEIELNNQNGKNFVVRRVIYKDNKSDWYLNDKPSKLKEIEELVKELNIQVANLCQFLPQEKVSEFAKMNMYELLENTEKAVGGVEMYDTHIELKDKSKDCQNYERDLKILEENLNKEEAINSRLKPQVEAYLEKEAAADKMEWLKKKRALRVYKMKRNEYEGLKKEKDAFKKQMEDIDVTFEPMLEKKKEAEKKLIKLKSSLAEKHALMVECTKSTKDIGTKLEDYAEKLNEVKGDYQTKESEFKTHKVKLKDVEVNIEALKTEYEEAKSQLDEIKIAENDFKKKETELRVEYDRISNKEFEIKQELSRYKAELDENQEKINEMKNVREGKLAKLRERNAPDIYAAIQWLERNKDKLKRNYYEPMFLSMNIKDKKASKYIEHLIPYRDLVQMFLFEDSSDMNLFLSEVRDRQKLTVNVAMVPVLTPQLLEQYKHFKPSTPISELKKYGFQTYLREVIEAPEAIINYSCLYFSIHNVPIGNEQTHRDLARIQSSIMEADITRFYTHTHQYAFLRSRYTKNVSSQSVEVPEGFWLTSSIDQTRLGECEKKNEELKKRVRDCEANLQTAVTEKKTIEKRMEAIRGELNKLRERRGHIDGIGKKLTAKQSLLKSLEQQNVDLFSEAKKWLSKVEEYAKKEAKLFQDYLDLAKNASILCKDKVTIVYQEAQLQAEKNQFEIEMRDYNEKKANCQEQFSELEKTVKEAKDEALKSLELAKKKLGVQLEQGLPEEIRAKFSELPESLEEIDAAIHHEETRAGCSVDVNPHVIEEYQLRQKTIEKSQKQRDTLVNKIDNHKSNYEEKKNKWLDDVVEMIKEINVKFSGLFKQLKCAGEVQLSRPDNPEEFAKYGISIRVSFRSEEQMQELTAHVQSGGEKSVSTMLYMISLQEMTRCPFRVVDEINQGMDPVNERKVFEIIVQNSCMKQQAQYFLLTPKLLPDLGFDEKANVICVFNGPNNIPHSHYNLKNFLAIRKKMNSDTA